MYAAYTLQCLGNASAIIGLAHCMYLSVLWILTTHALKSSHVHTMYYARCWYFTDQSRVTQGELIQQNKRSKVAAARWPGVRCPQWVFLLAVAGTCRLFGNLSAGLQAFTSECVSPLIALDTHRHVWQASSIQASFATWQLMALDRC